MANTSDTLLQRLESVSWMYSINCQIHGKDTTLLLKFLIEEDFYAVMVTDMTQTYFECLEGKDIDEHYRRFNKGEVKRERLISHLKTLLTDVTKAYEWHFETLLVDCHTSRLTLKVKNQLIILKFEWSFYMISTNPETLSKHVTLPLIRLIASLNHGIDLLKKEIKSKDKLLDQTDNKKDGSVSDDLVNKMLTYQRSLTTGVIDNSVIIGLLVADETIHSLLKNEENGDQNVGNSCEKSTKNNLQTNVKQNADQNNVNQSQISANKEISQTTPLETRKKSPTRQNKKLKL
ncbi:uncharacterized protein LOC128959880 [Oppia nitens]|uniref:uncharacterized protein LOC128959880 n=1 Tax=Oppia nitens TaxID=1686743 RepID=UPI0023DCE968|nr:uncharacterized protein LOC128959880 [Oppia nitens]